MYDHAGYGFPYRTEIQTHGCCVVHWEGVIGNLFPSMWSTAMYRLGDVFTICE